MDWNALVVQFDNKFHVPEKSDLVKLVKREKKNRRYSILSLAEKECPKLSRIEKKCPCRDSNTGYHGHNVEQILAQKGEKVMRMDDKQVLEFLHKEDLK